MSELTGNLIGPVEVVGTGLLGTSIGLALRRAGVEVLLSDESSDHLRTASGMGAGRPRTDADRPQLVVVAVPPDHLGDVIAEALRSTDAVVTDVGSVKSGPLAAVADVPGRRALRRQPPDGRQRALRAAGRDAPRSSTAGPGR